MLEPEILKEKEVGALLHSVIEKAGSAIMTHLSKGKWHMTKVLLTHCGDETIHVEIPAKEKPTPINIQTDQPVGLSLKHGYNKFVFETVVVGFEPSVNSTSGGRIVIALPDKIEKLQRRNYFRVAVPKSLAVKVLFWHRGYKQEISEAPKENYWQAGLIDISAGGLQIGVDVEQGPNFKAGQFVGLQFTPQPYEKPVLLEAQVRHIAKTADGKSVCLGLQIIGLEASVEGRNRLRRLCSIVEQYQKMHKKPQEAVAE